MSEFHDAFSLAMWFSAFHFVWYLTVSALVFFLRFVADYVR